MTDDRKVYRYRSNYGRIFDEIDGLLSKGEIRLTNFSKLNDVFEGRPAPLFVPEADEKNNIKKILVSGAQFAIDAHLEPDPMIVLNEYIENERHEFERRRGRYGDYIEYLRSRLRSVSFSKRMDSELMWAHYGNAHHGWCFEFDRAPVWSRFSRDSLRDVTYLRKRPTIAFSDAYGFAVLTRIIEHASIQASADLVQDFSRLQLGQVLESGGFQAVLDAITLSKSLSWSYEEEVRIVDIFSECGFMPVRSIQLKGIIFGLQSDPAWHKKILDRYGDQLSIKRISLDDTNYDLSSAEI